MKNKEYNKHSIERNGKVIYKKFAKYLLPCALTNVALSLNDFFDSLLVAQLLSAKAMAIINICSPLIFIACAIYFLVGDGGVVLYSQLLGERKKDEANSVLTTSTVLSFVLGLLVMIFGLILIKPLTILLSTNNADLYSDLLKYLVPLLIAIPFITVTLSIQAFFPGAGNPEVTTKISIYTNVLNIVMDIVYIRFFNFGVEGASLATLTAYVYETLYIIYLFKFNKVNLTFGKFSLKNVKSTITKGLPDSVGQIGLTIRTNLCNSLALMFGGEIGVIVLSVCEQFNSFMWIFYNAISDSMGPIISTLYGQRDHEGNNFMIKKLLVYTLIIGVVGVGLINIFPHQFLTIYDVGESDFVFGTFALRVYSLQFILRPVYIAYRQVLTSIDHEKYATFMSIFDGIILISVSSFILTYIFGINGLFFGGLLTSVIMMTLVIIVNMISLKKNDKYDNILLLPKSEANSIIYNASLGASNKSISNLSESIINFSKENNLDNELSYKLGLLAEEMVVYTRNHHKGHFDIDVIMNITDLNIYMDFRSDTTPFNPLAKDEKDSDENYTFLSKIASSIEYDYILGMNSTRIIINRIS